MKHLGWGWAFCWCLGATLLACSSDSDGGSGDGGASGEAVGGDGTAARAGASGGGGDATAGAGGTNETEEGGSGGDSASGNGGEDGGPMCKPLTCEARGMDCGSSDDGCGNSLSCGGGSCGDGLATANDVWLVGVGVEPDGPRFHEFDHWNGTSITYSTPFAGLGAPYAGGAVRGIWGSSASDIWAVGDRGSVFHRVVAP